MTAPNQQQTAAPSVLDQLISLQPTHGRIDGAFGRPVIAMMLKPVASMHYLGCVRSSASAQVFSRPLNGEIGKPTITSSTTKAPELWMSAKRRFRPGICLARLGWRRSPHYRISHSLPATTATGTGQRPSLGRSQRPGYVNSCLRSHPHNPMGNSAQDNRDCRGPQCATRTPETISFLA